MSLDFTFMSDHHEVITKKQNVGLVQDCNNSSELAMELLWCCIKYVSILGKVTVNCARLSNLLLLRILFPKWLNLPNTKHHKDKQQRQSPKRTQWKIIIKLIVYIVITTMGVSLPNFETYQYFPRTMPNCDIHPVWLAYNVSNTIGAVKQGFKSRGLSSAINAESTCK